LQAYRRLNALQTVGYTELFDFLDGNISLEQAGKAIKSNTRRYAKRQLTWFKKDSSVKWLDHTTLNKKTSFYTIIKLITSPD
jgi:tRNA dimethylallyltransferase